VIAGNFWERKEEGKQASQKSLLPLLFLLPRNNKK
jgi:hypothetical protein